MFEGLDVDTCGNYGCIPHMQDLFSILNYEQKVFIS